MFRVSLNRASNTVRLPIRAFNSFENKLNQERSLCFNNNSISKRNKHIFLNNFKNRNDALAQYLHFSIENNTLKLLQHSFHRNFSTSSKNAESQKSEKSKENTKSKGSNNSNEESNRKLAYSFLLTLCILTAAIVNVGGLTRLTESGLSMTSWSLLGGLPPSTTEEWDQEFERYKTFPEFKRGRRDMTLEEFKKIYFYEYTHRMIGRGIGFIYFAFCFAFWKRGGFKQFPYVKNKALILGSLIGAQGLIGWWMVKSGLEDTEEALFNKYNTIARVSQYRLVTHLSMAFAIYSISLWSFLDLYYSKTNWNNVPATASKFSNRIRSFTPIVTFFIYLTALSGGFVAGMDAGLIYNEFPYMGKGLVPEEYWSLTPKWLNFFENPSSAQFNHRLLATFTASTVLIFSHYAMRGKMFLPPPLRFAFAAMGVVAAFQYLLGLLTLLSHVHIHSAALHQMGSLALITFGLSAVKLSKRLPK